MYLVLNKGKFSTLKYIKHLLITVILTLTGFTATILVLLKTVGILDENFELNAKL